MYANHSAPSLTGGWQCVALLCPRAEQLGDVAEYFHGADFTNVVEKHFAARPRVRDVDSRIQGLFNPLVRLCAQWSMK